MFNGYRQKRAIENANRVTKQGVTLKRQSRVNEAVVLLEDYIENNMATKLAPPLAIAIVYKSIGKLYFLQRQRDLAVQAYVVAISQLIQIDAINEASTCAFHLGCCSDEFLRSNQAADYYHGIQTGQGQQPGMPGSLFSIEVTRNLAMTGMNMYNKAVTPR